MRMRSRAAASSIGLLSPRRSGYTLLEVILAIAIGLLIVAALYVALDVQIRYMHAGRNAVVEGQLARGLLTRITGDIKQSMALLPTDPSVAGSGSGSGGSGGSSGPSSGGTPSAGGNGNSGAATGRGGSGSSGGANASGGANSGGNSAGNNSSSSNNSSNSASGGSSSSPTGQINYGIQGDETQLTLYVSTIPRYGRLDLDQQNGISDMRVVTYYLAPNQGLARQEVKAVTETDNSNDPPPELLAAEVVDLQFRYYDGAAQQWTTSWDGTTSGPPYAVEVKIGIQARPEAGTVFSGDRPTSYYRAVVSIPTSSIPQSAVNSSGSSPTGGSQ